MYWMRLCLRLALCLTLSIVSLFPCSAGDTPPTTVFMTASSPRTLLRSMDSLLVAILKGTPKEDSYQPGMAPTVAATLEMPWLFDNDSLTLGMAVDFDEDFEPMPVFLLNGIDFDELCGRLKAANFPTVVDGKSALVDIGQIQAGKMLSLLKLPSNAILVATDRAVAAAFAEKIGDWLPAHPSDCDVRVLVNLLRLRESGSKQIAMFRAMVKDPNNWRDFLESVPASFPPEFRMAVRDAMIEYTEKHVDLALNIDLADVRLTVADEMLDLAFFLTPAKGSAWAEMVRAYAGAGDPEYRLASAIESGASFFAAENRPNFSLTGGFFPFMGERIARKYLPDRVGELESLLADFAAAEVRERISAVYLRGLTPTRVSFVGTADGRTRVDAWMRTADLVNTGFNRVVGSRDVPYLKSGNGTVGKAAYRTVRANLSEQGALTADNQDAKPLDLNDFPFYFAANRNTAVTLLSHKPNPEDLLEQVNRIGSGRDGALIGDEAVEKLLSRLTPRQVGHTLFKPIELFNWLVRVVSKNKRADGGSIDLQDSGAWAGACLGLRSGDVFVRLSVPLAAINDATVNGQKLEGVEYSPEDGVSDFLDAMAGEDEDGDDDWGADAESEELQEIRKAAISGDASAQFDLGRAYDLGHYGLEIDYQEALKWYKLAANQNMFAAMNNIGVIYAENLDQPEEGFRWVEKAAVLGNSFSQRVLALYYLNGTGVEKDVERGKAWYMAAANNGEAAACLNLGLMYGIGDHGVDINLPLALYWYGKGDELGDLDCIRNIGVIHMNGGPGVDRNPPEAIKFYARAADAGDGTAQYYLGMTYMDGAPGVGVDLSKAKYWLAKAVESEVDGAAELLERIPNEVQPRKDDDE